MNTKRASAESPHVAIIGAGVGGLAAAIRLAAAGMRITVFERGLTIGGKARSETLDGRTFDTGPTVVTLPHVFEALFAAAGESLHDHVHLTPAEVLSRHFWAGGTRLDLFADVQRSRSAIDDVFGAREAEGFDRFVRHARRVYQIVERPFMGGQRPTLTGTLREFGVSALPDLFRIDGLRSLWTALGDFFDAPQLRQLFARYATYVGSSPFKAPATLAVIAGVELAGVYCVEGGIRRLIAALSALAERLGVEFRLGTGVESLTVREGRVRGLRLDSGAEVTADAIIHAGDAGALTTGLLGPEVADAISLAGERALSAVTLAGLGTVIDAELSHHNVFFAADPAAEFGALFDDRAVPADPTLYLCAQDRPPRSQVPPIGSPERMLALINAPALPAGDSPPCPPQPTDVPRAARSRSSSSWTSMPSTLDACETWMRRRLAGAGVEMDPKATTLRRGPADWASLYPGTGGSLYGQASHGWRQAFLRPGARTRLPGLYLAGGSVHPGAGLPMAASSGARAAEALWVDLHSTRGSRPAAMPGGMSTPSPTTAAMR